MLCAAESSSQSLGETSMRPLPTGPALEASSADQPGRLSNLSISPPAWDLLDPADQRLDRSITFPTQRATVLKPSMSGSRIAAPFSFTQLLASPSASPRPYQGNGENLVQHLDRDVQRRWQDLDEEDPRSAGPATLAISFIISSMRTRWRRIPGHCCRLTCRIL